MIVERTVYLPKPGRLDAVIATRRRACAVRRGLGLLAGEIWVGEEADGQTRVHWECRFPTPDAHAADLRARDESPDFGAVRAEMRGNIDAFERHVLRPDAEPASVLSHLSLEGVAVVPEEVRFPAEGRELAGFLYRPPGEGPFPCMVTNHGSSIHQGTTDLCRPGVAAQLLQWGIASFLPHRRGYGNSPGTPWREDVPADYGTADYDRQLQARLDAESRDVIAALDWLEARPEIDTGHIGVMGSSFGGVMTLLAAAACPRFRCAVEFAGAAMNWERAPGLRAFLLDRVQAVTQPILFLQAENDYSARPTRELSAALEGTGRTVEAIVYPGCGLTKDEGHFLYGQGIPVWAEDVRRFLDRHL